MPRIDPLQLLKCLSVLLAPDGGIKSKEEVSRLVSLMTKFSKKLVSKCIYIQILRATKSDLLDMFMGAGGWDLTHQWLLDAIMAKNHPLNCEILQLLSLCPVNVERLRSNSCPKLVKNLSMESTNESEKMLANNLVIQWMQVVRNEVDVDAVSGHSVAVVDVPLVDKSEPESSMNVDYVEETNVESRTNNSPSNTEPEVISVQPLEKQAIESENVQSVTVVESEEVRTEEAGGTSEDSNPPWDAPAPLYKIMIRDGKQVLAKVYSEKRQSTEIPTATAAPYHHNVSGTVIINVTPTEEKVVEVAQPSESPVIVAPCSMPEKDSEEPVKIEEAVEHVEEEEEVVSVPESKAKAVASEIVPKGNEVVGRTTREAKKKLKDSKPAVAPPSEKKPRLQESAAKEKRERERERVKAKERTKEEKKKEVKSSLQAEKDKETLAKIMIVSSAVSKTVGKIPRKNRTSEDNNGEVKKVSPAPEVKRAPKASVSIERRTPGILGEPRPKTVKTFNSKFRSTGLEEEVKPPPPRSATKKNTTSEKNSRIAIPPRRPSPPREVYPPEKRPRPGVGIVTDVASPSVGAHVHAEELPRKGEKAVTKTNVNKAKDKAPHAYLQESDVFMDALTAVTRKEPRRRKRRTSNSKDDEKVKGKEGEHRKDDDGHYAVGTPPYSPDEKSPPVIKPSFKFYQDTLETDEDNKKIKEENTHEDEHKVLAVKKEGRHSSESDGSDEDSKTRSGKRNHEVDFNDEMKRIKQEDDEGESSGSDDSSKRRDGSNQGLKGVLVYHKKAAAKAKKIVRWKEDGELEKIVYFELDETERVNVTKTFMDMKQMERTHERQAFLMARKLAHEDVMEEKMTWKALIPLLLPAPLAEPGSKSREKDVQYAREKVVLQSLYFHRDMIPDSAAEPDTENHPTTDPAIIPLNDVSGNLDSVNDFQSTPWPEPKPFQPPVVLTTPHVHSGASLPMMPGIPEHNDASYIPPHPHQNMMPGHPMVAGGMGIQYGGIHPPQMVAPHLHGGFAAPAVANPNMMAPMDNSMLPRSSHPMNMQGSRPLLHPPTSQQLPMNNMINPNIQGVAAAGGGDWRTADGKVVPVEESQPMVMYPQGGVPDVGIGGNNAPQMDGEMNSGYEMEYGGVQQYQEGMEEGHVGGPGYMMPPMGYTGGTGGNVRPPHGGVMGYGHPPMFRGNSRGGRGGPAPSRGGPWFRPSGPMPPRGRGGNWEGGRGRGGRGGLRVTVCKHFRAGYCRNGEQCSFLHPGVNGPPVPYMYSE